MDNNDKNTSSSIIQSNSLKTFKVVPKMRSSDKPSALRRNLPIIISTILLLSCFGVIYYTFYPSMSTSLLKDGSGDLTEKAAVSDQIKTIDDNDPLFRHRETDIMTDGAPVMYDIKHTKTKDLTFRNDFNNLELDAGRVEYDLHIAKILRNIEDADNVGGTYNIGTNDRGEPIGIEVKINGIKGKTSEEKVQISDALKKSMNNDGSTLHESDSMSIEDQKDVAVTSPDIKMTSRSDMTSLSDMIETSQVPSLTSVDASMTSERSRAPHLHIVTSIPMLSASEELGKLGYASLSSSQLLQRHLEFMGTLQNNLNLDFVEQIHILTNIIDMKIYLENENLDNFDKISVHYIDVGITYRVIMEFISENLVHECVVFMNGDIYLSNEFTRVNSSKMLEKHIAYAITRMGNEMSGLPFVQCPVENLCVKKYHGSHDAFVFVLEEPFPQDALENLDYPMNKLGAENVLIWQLEKKMGYTVLNPCKILRIFHNHCSNIRANFTVNLKERVDTGMHGRAPYSNSLYT
ncbi:unnamed protein product [Owenia fusiformis]|uniref:Uncharacterized protein n=1 Tax=Owenia fusiformis TaxID=6347 RepID=A0A8J1TKE2_OWEFU|nr:unnamed protein product [Owenia fusiformis]